MGHKILAGRYEIYEKIGEGGMAVVYKARDKLLSRMVAIKILRPEFVTDTNFVESFRRESRAAASLSHPNIVNIYDVGKEGNIYYIVMELVDGRPLSEIIAEEAPLDYKYTISVAEQVAAALVVAHKNNIIHRDVKPHNILITPDGSAKITDFGIARAVSDGTIVSEHNVVMGSVHYFSPEQGRGQYVDEKSDIYSLGIVMYEMLTGRVPFDADHPVTVAMMHMNDNLIPPSKVVEGVPPGLDQIVVKATEKYQVNRFRSAEEMLAALQNVSFVTGWFEDEGIAGIFKRPNEGGADEVYAGEPGADDGGLESDEQHGDDRGADETDDDYDEDDEDEDAALGKKRRRKEAKTKRNGKKGGRFGKYKALAIVLALIVALPVSYGLYKGITYLTTDRGVEAPDLIGLNEEKATKKAEDLKLKLEVAEEVFSDEHEVGLVVDQDPKAKEKVKKGSTIRVNLSKGPETVTPTDNSVPDVLGKSLASAEYTIQQYGFTRGNVSYADSEKPIDTVIDQSPKAGDKVASGSAINLTISQGAKPKEVSMPNLIGMTEQEARNALTNAGLNLSGVDSDFSVDYRQDTVMWQQYKTNTKLSEGQGVKIIISKGPEEKTSTVSITIDFSGAPDGTPAGGGAETPFKLSVLFTNGDGSQTYIVNAADRFKSAGSESVSVTGKGNGRVEVYFNGALNKTYSVDFNTGKAS
ncbi:MAG: Stk1 family PASTA domain-containing Ser/Thr kinase [Clostridiales Family XIII bacterium]|jgi:serine/threonine-protein kinase|nr:Stk1 family PASTA domain-containing Ser/Thr kinase [Clostridiales Family XIII bacterium]